MQLGSLEGKGNDEVMALYAKYHPNKSQPFDGNECLNESWDQLQGEDPVVFESYRNFKQRIIKNITSLEQQYPGKVIAVFTHYEPLRDAILFSRGTEHFFTKTSFGASIAERMGKNPIEIPMSAVMRRTIIKAEKAAGLQLHIINGECFVNDSFKIRVLQDTPKG